MWGLHRLLTWRPLRNNDLSQAITFPTFSQIIMCSSHSQIQHYLYEQSYNFEEVQLQRIKLEWGAFRFQTVPLGAEKHSPMECEITPWSSQKHRPLSDCSSSPSSLIPNKGCTCKQDWTWSSGCSGTGSVESSSCRGGTVVLLVAASRPAQANREASSLGSMEGRLEASMGRCPVPATSSGTAGHGSRPQRSGNKLLKVPNDTGSGHSGIWYSSRSYQ